MKKINNDVELIMLDKHNMKPLIDYINELQCYKERNEKALKILKEKDRAYMIFHNNWRDCGIGHAIDILEGKED